MSDQAIRRTPIPQATARLYSPGMDLDRAHRNLIDAAALVAMAEHLQVSPLDAQEMLDIARRLIREALDDLAGSGVARIGLCGASH